MWAQGLEKLCGLAWMPTSNKSPRQCEATWTMWLAGWSVWMSASHLVADDLRAYVIGLHRARLGKSRREQNESVCPQAADVSGDPTEGPGWARPGISSAEHNRSAFPQSADTSVHPEGRPDWAKSRLLHAAKRLPDLQDYALA